MKGSPRIALVVPTFPKLSETFIVRHFLGLRAQGLDVHVVCDASPPEAWSVFPELQAEAQRVHLNPPTQPRWQVALRAPLALAKRVGKIPRRAWKLAYRDAALLDLAPDLVHWEFGATLVGREGLKELLDARFLVSFRGYDLSHSGLDDPHYYDRLWQVADGVHVLGEFLRQRARERGCPLEPTLIPPAVPLPPAAPLANAAPSAIETARPIHLVSVGRADWKKGGEYALQAVAELVARGFELKYTVVGDGDFFEALAFARHQLGLEQVVELPGALPPAEVARTLATADIFLHLAVSEAFGNAVLEAQAAGLPVVCSDAGGLRENVVDGETGLVVPRRDPAAAAAALATLIADPALRQRLGAAGRRRVAEFFTLERQTAAFVALYRQMLGS